MTAPQALLVIIFGAGCVADGLWFHRAARRRTYFWTVRRHRGDGMALRGRVRLAQTRYSRYEAVVGAAGIILGALFLAHR